MANDVEVKFGASINGLLDGVAESKDALDGLSSYISGLGDSFKEVAEAIGVAFAIDKIAEFDSEFAELGEQIERTSKILGVSGENIQLFSLAMKMAGGDSETAGMTLNILQKNIGDAISKAGPARTAFDNMGFSLEKLKSTDVVTLLFQIKERMDEAGTSAEQSALKQDYLRTVAGRQAAQFLALGMTLDEVRKLGQQTGYVMSGQMTSDASELSESTKHLDVAWKGLSNTVSDKVSPAYKGFIDYMAQLIEKTNELISANDHLDSQDKPYDPTGMLKHYLPQDPPPAPTPPQRFGPKGMPLGKGEFGPSQPPAAKPLPPLSTEAGGDKEDNGDLDFAKNQYQTEIETSHLAFEQIKQDQQGLVDSKKETASEGIAAVQAALDLEKLAVMSALDQEAALYERDSVEYAQVQSKKAIATQQFTLETSRLSTELAKAQEEDLKKTEETYKSLFSSLDRAMDGALQGILQGTQTFTQATERLFGDMVTSILEDIAKIALRWAAFEAAQRAFGAGDAVTKALGSQVPSSIGGTQQNSLLNAAMTKLAAVLGLNTAAHTASTVATTGNTVATATDTAATASSTVGTAGLAVATTAGTVATTVNTTTTASSGLLHIAAIGENTIATAANTIATWAGDAIHSLIPLATGAWNIPSDMPAFLHAGEMVVPADTAAAIRNGGGFSGAGSGGGSAAGNVTINISAVDSQSVANLFKSNSGALVQALSGQMRNFNPALRTG